MLLHTLQRPSLSLTSRMAWARCAASSRPARSTWNAMRCADFCPMPGSRLNSLMSRANGSAKSGILEQARRQAHAAEHASHFLFGLGVNLLDGLVAGGDHHILQHLHVARDFGI